MARPLLTYDGASAGRALNQPWVDLLTGSPRNHGAAPADGQPDTFRVPSSVGPVGNLTAAHAHAAAAVPTADGRRVTIVIGNQ
mgnify:FL=1